ncbi:MAG TPA: hypothetical protein VGH20_11985 [Myxococcales bacterium]|jgi:hypothetical protein
MQLQPFDHPAYELVRPFFSAGFQRVTRVYAPDGQLVATVEQPFFRLRTELVAYADEAQLSPLFVIRTRRLATLDREHDLLDPGGARLGCLRTRGVASLFRDQWDILGDDDAPAGEMVEEGPALWRRFFRLLPGQHRIDLGGRTVARVRQEFHFFRRVFQLRILPVEDPIEPRFAIACALVAMMADLRRERSR